MTADRTSAPQRGAKGSLDSVLPDTFVVAVNSAVQK